MRARIAKNGILDLQPHEVLEYMLYAFIPRRDTNEIAHRLLDEFGSVFDVLNAPPHLLLQVKGVTENAALFLSSLPDVFRKYLSARLQPEKKKVSGRKALRDYIGSMMYNRTNEVVCLAALDVHDQLLCCDIVSVGAKSEVRFDTKMVLDYAQKRGAHAVLVAHNHPSGSTSPSADDIGLTYQTFVALKALGMQLYDHLIFSGNSFYSFEENRWLESMQNKFISFKEGVDNDEKY